MDNAVRNEYYYIDRIREAILDTPNLYIEGDLEGLVMNIYDNLWEDLKEEFT